MNLTVRPTESLRGDAKAPSSKSYTIRALTAALLADGVSLIKEPLYSEDTKACIIISGKLGARIEKKQHDLLIRGVAGIPKYPDSELDSLNSGTTLRIMTAVASLCDREITLTGDESIQKRPIQPLVYALRQLGVTAQSNNGFPPVKVRGPLMGGVCMIDGSVSSQFISALLMALPCAVGKSSINIAGGLRSKPYIDMTLDVLNDFKIRVASEGQFRYNVPGGQIYRAAKYTVEGDYSSAAFLLAAAALTKSKVRVMNLLNSSKQADRKIVSILQDMGASVSTGERDVTVNGSGTLKGIEVDLNNSPDLLPITAVLGALAEGKTRIFNVEHARLKECDRIKAMATELKKMGADITENQDGLDITGGKLKGAPLDGWRDHRIVMALAIAGLRAEGKTEITDREYAGITFPRFIETMKALGAGME
jgi:3-phosphoshikimate 1-carboxyvinyltransferase